MAISCGKSGDNPEEKATHKERKGLLKLGDLLFGK
jgi:hypothetical protein